jgi:uncharacterized protein YndB with AHSA1/START domain/uncharacterized protein YciI
MTLRKDVQAVADVPNGLVLLSVEIGAPPERVFRALTDPDDVMRWWKVPGGFGAREWESDTRAGGKWRCAGVAQDGKTHTMHGEYTVVEPPHKLAFTWNPSWDEPYTTQVTYTLEAIDGGTLLTLRHEGFADRAEICRNHTKGWTRVLSLLEADLSAALTPMSYFFMRLIPPRPDFAPTMTSAERELMMAHSNYWRGKLVEGKIIVFGPVSALTETWGMGVLRVSNLAEAQALTAQDPVMLNGSGFRYEHLPMPNAVHA